MPNIAITSKETKQLLLSADTNTVTLSENSVVKIDTAIEDVASITREGNAAIVNLKNGEKVVIESYFDDPLDSHHIVFDNGEQLYWAEFANAAGEILPTIKYHFIETISPLLYADTLAALMPWVTGAVAAGATIAAVGSDSDSASSNTPVDSTAAEQLVIAAEEAQQAAEDLLNQAQEDGLITSEEQAQLQDAADAAAEAKDTAQDAVTALPESADKEELQDRLDNLEGISVPPVTDADGNGKDDAVEAAEALVTDAENAHQAAEDVIAGAQEDGLITPAEQQAIQDAVDAATEAEQTAQDAVTALPESTDKDGLQDRLDTLTDITVPAVTDTDGNGIDDAVDAQIADTEAAVKAAEDAYQAAEDALEEANANGLITPTEKAELEEALKAAQDAKDAAQDAVDALPSSPAAVQDAKDGFQDRIDALTDITIPAVNDANENGVDDSTENPVDLATDLVEAAEDAYQAAEDALTDANTDGLITPEEQAALEDALKDAQDAKDAAQNAVDALPDSADKDALQDRIDALTDITVPAVTDTDGNGIDDAVDAQIADAEAAVKAAEDAYQAAEDALEEANANGLITPTEKAALEEALQAAQDAKDAAQDAVDALPSSPAAVQDAKDGFQDRIDALTDITIPAVNDANENGVDDSTENPVDLATDLVEVAEDAYQAAEDALTDANTDGLITPEEQAALEDALKDAQDAKDAAQNAVDALPDSADKDALQDRIDALTDITVPAVTDTDGNGIDDAVDAQIADAEAAVKAAEDAYQAAEDALEEANANGLITPTEKAALEEALQAAQDAKDAAQDAVDALPSSPAAVQDAKDGFQDRIDALTDITIPAVNDANENGVDDSTENPVDLATDLVEVAEDAYQAAEDALTAANTDGLITPEEKAALEDALKDAQDAKDAAQNAVDALPDSADKDALQDRLDALTDIVLPTVNDENGNGIDDATDLSSVEDLVADAEQAYQDAADALAAAESDNLITPSELATLTQNLADAQQAKADAQAAVDAIEAEYPTAAGKFQDRLDALTDIVLPTVNDENGNGIDDATDLSSVEDLVADAEQAYQDAADALAAAESDNLITPSELATLTQNLADAQQAKADAQAAVDAIEAEYPTAAGKFQDRLDALTDIVLPTVNDENGNGIDDATDLSSVEDLVADAEQAYQDAADALAAAESDNLITPSELATLTQNLADAQQAKADAQAAVDAIEAEYPTAAGKFQDRLDALTDIVLPTVNDENGNGIDDATDLSSVEDLVADAEQAYQDAADALAAAESDNLITPSELATLTQNLADAQQAKADAQAAVNGIVDDFPTEAADFQGRLNDLTDIVIPAVTDSNNNGVDDATEIAAVEDLVAAAEAAYAAADQALTDALVDGVTQAEVDDLTQALADAQQAKADAQAAVNGIVDDFPTEAADFQGRLNDLTDIVIPAVTDSNNNGVDDATEIAAVEDLVAAAEAAYAAADQALADAIADNAVTQAEVDALTQDLADAQQAKADAQAAVNGIVDDFPTEAADFQGRLNDLTDIVIPAVTDSNNNGVDDATEIAAVEDLVAAAEAAYAAADQALTDALVDGVTQAEVDDLTQALADAQQAKADAQAAVNGIVDDFPTEAADFQGRLNDLTDIVIPAVTDSNNNGVDDATEIAAVEDLVAEAEAAYQAADQALTDALVDGVTQAEVDDLTQALADAQQAKADAQAAVNGIVDDFPTEAADFQGRLNDLTDIVIPAVTDSNNNGVDDATEIAAVEDLVAAAEAAYAAADQALTDALVDGVTQAEVDDLTQALADAQQAKADAQAAVNGIVDDFPTEAADFQGRLNDLTDIVIPAVTDSNNNGVDDATEIAAVEDLVAEAEAAYQAVDQALTDALVDGVTQAEVDDLTQALADAQQAKADAQAAVNGIVDDFPTEAADFQGRLNDLTDIVIPAVTDSNNNGVDDATEIAAVEDLVAEAEAAYQAADQALTDALVDGVTQAEVDDLTQALADAQQAKADAQAAVNGIVDDFPTEAADFQGRLNDLTDIVIPAVTDSNNNGVDDATEIAAVEDLVAEAEAAYQAADQALTDALVDGVTQAEVDDLTQALADAQQAKADAQAAVNGIVDDFPTEAADFQGRLNDLTDIVIPAVTDSNNNGVDDATEIAAVEDLVAEAEAAYQAADQALTDALVDGVTQAEVDDLTQALADAQQAKADAQAAVNGIVDDFPTEAADFQGRLNDLTDIVIPAVTDSNNNGVDDATEIAAVEDLVAEAEAAYQAADQALTDALVDGVTQAEVDDLTQALADAQQAKADAQAAVNGIVDDFPTEAADFQGRLNDLTDIVIPAVTPTLNAINDEYVLDMGQEALIERDAESYNDVTYIDLLGGTEGEILGADFSIPQDPNDVGQAHTGNITITASQQDFLSVAEAFQLIVYQNVDGVQTEVARIGNQGGVVTLGGVGILGIVNNPGGISVTLSDLPEGEYTAVVAKDSSLLSDLIYGIELDKLGGEEAILGASNEQAIYNAINAVLTPELAAPLVTLVQAILVPVNTIGLPISSVVSQLLDVLPVEVIDELVNQVVGPLVTNTLTLYENTDITIDGTEETFPTYTFSSNVFEDNGNGVDVAPAGTIISEIDGTPVSGIEIIQGDYGVLEINTVTGAFTYKVTTGEEALGKTEIFNYTIQNGTQTDTAQIIIDISGTAFDDGTLLPPDYLDQVVANDDLATVQNYYEEPGDDIGTTGGASQLLGVSLVGIDISLGSEVPFNFEVEQNTTSDVTIDVSGSVLNLGLGVLGSILGLNSPQLFNAVLERRYVDENDVSQVEYIVVPNAITLNPGVTSTYSGTVTVEDLPPGTYTLALQETPQNVGLLQSILNVLDDALSTQLFGGIDFTITDQTNKYLGSNEIEGNVISSNDGADLVNSTTYVKLVSNELGDPEITIDNVNTVVEGAYGTLYISPNGAYKYVSNGDLADIGKVDTFTYTIRDFNGSEDTAQLNIRIDGEGLITWPSDLTEVDADQAVVVNATNDVGEVSTSLVYNPATTFTATSVTSGLTSVDSNAPVTKSLTFVVGANDGATSVSTSLTIADASLTASITSGTVTAVLKDTLGVTQQLLTAPNVSTTLGATTLNFNFNELVLNSGTYTIEYSFSGLTSTGLGSAFPLTLTSSAVTMNKIDLDTYQAINSTELTETGNIFTDGTADSLANKFTTLTIGTQTLTQSSGDVVITGTYGNLTISGDGEYSYQANTANYGGVETFNYTLTSLSGETSTATLTIGVGRDFTSSAFNDFITTNSNGGDTVIYNLLNSASNSGGNGTDIWKDFSATQGDKIDLSALLQGQAVDANTLSHFVSVEQRGDDTVVTIDRDGSATDTTYAKTDLIILENTTASNLVLDDLIKYNQI